MVVSFNAWILGLTLPMVGSVYGQWNWGGNRGNREALSANHQPCSAMERHPRRCSQTL